MTKFDFSNPSAYYGSFESETSNEKYGLTEELLQKSNDNNLIQKVFENPIIIEKILKNQSTDAMNQLRFRNINKSFNAAVLHRIRQEHREVVIDGNVDSCGDEYWKSGTESTDNTIKVNRQSVEPSKLYPYFRFLNSVAGVKVKKLVVKELPVEYFKKDLHDDIIDVLIDREYDHVEEFVGMKSLCSIGCESCGGIAQKSKKYGPVQTSVIDELIEEPTHFDSLILSDRDLFEYGNNCTLLSNSRENALEQLNNAISSLVTCDHLDVILTNNTGIGRYSEIGGSGGKFSHCYPREVLDCIIQKWKVKTVKLEFRDSGFETNQNVLYSEFLTKASFDVPFKKTQITKEYSLESVEVDLHFFSDGFGQMEDFLETESFINILANVRRILPTKNIRLRFPKDFDLFTMDNLDEHIPKLLKMAELDLKRNTSITFDLFPISTGRMEKIPEILNSGARFLNEERNGNHFYLDDITNVFDDGFVGKKFKLKNEMSQNLINFNVFFTREFLNKFFENSENRRSFGYLRHFWSFV
uniref:F-box domain-containing protein n=1 Tax=Caenorhabditis tropicalis TaxID=1561998 RepID=A0A1I7TMT7_9PELO